MLSGQMEIHRLLAKAFDAWDPFCETTLVESPELQDCLKNNWPEELHPAIRCLLVHSFNVFNQSTQHIARKRKRTEVSHAQFIDILDTWLATYTTLTRIFKLPRLQGFWEVGLCLSLACRVSCKPDFRSHFVGI
jgi:hypothetical protein